MKSEIINQARETWPNPTKTSSDEYDDDFDSYESDFEKYSPSSTASDTSCGEESSSTNTMNTVDDQPKTLADESLHVCQKKTASVLDEEKKLDSGNYELPDYRHKQMLKHIREAVESENSNLSAVDQRINPASLSDEGFEDQKSLQFINFAEAKKKFEQQKILEHKKKRGADILSMIRLDECSFTLFELEPIPYEVFIKTFGKSNSVQTSVQTGHDDVSEEVQTDIIETENKWTQFPSRFEKIDETQDNFWDIYRCNQLGVGNDIVIGGTRHMEESVNENRFNRFVSSSCNLILDILREDTITKTDNLQQADIVFSDGYITFNTSDKMLAECNIECLEIYSENCNKILSVHNKTKQNMSIICCWDICDFDKPLYYLISYDLVTCCTFSVDDSDIIFSGQRNGFISVWNTKDTRDKYDVITNTPNYLTKIGDAHTSQVVSIKPFKEDDENLFSFNDMLSQICSLDEFGEIVFWNFFKHIKNDLALVKTFVIDLKVLYPDLAELRCMQLAFNHMNTNFMYISTNYGFILHYLHNGVRSNVSKFIPDSHNECTILETCPFSSNYFLAGFKDGTLGLYSRLVEVPLMVFSNKDNFDTSSIQLIQWSKTKPFLLYAKDSSNHIHIWDLSKSDIYPEYTIPFGTDEEISCMRLSPTSSKGNPFMLLGTEHGKLYWHLLNSEHGQQSDESFEKNINMFFNYVNRL